ncbi:MAG TPA: ubiquinol-cytochrome c reductase iron-sulfur subunit [Ktedonobacterales bacterium]|nr:ubiquinol-cytochrome c reductase iron-sulfur subunit [Ktedonobacterales bacterium]
MSIDTNRTPQEYEVLHGGGAETAEVAKRGISRRQLLRRATLLSLGLVGGVGTFEALTMFYPNLAGQFGSVIQLKAKSNYVAAAQKDFILDQRGVFYEANAKSYIMHLQSPQFLLSGDALSAQLDAENWVKDSDGTYWLAIYQVCVHLGCKFPFRDDCNSFKCPCHGSHYNVDGEYLDGPAPRSADRFELNFQNDNVMVNTGVLNQHVERPDASTRILPYLGGVCPA